MSELKAIYRDSANLGAFVSEYGFGQGKVFFMTVTFKRNMNKLECAGAFNVFRTFLNKRSVRESNGLPASDFHYIAVWEQHKKGGWHLHILGHIAGAGTNRLRACIRHFLSVTSTAVGFIHVIWTKGRDSNGIKYYMTKYLTKEKRKKGVRYVNYSRNWCRPVCLPFSWAGGAAAMWRKACRELALNFPRSFEFFYRHCSYRLRSSVLTAWMNGDFMAAVLMMGQFRSFRYDDFKLDFCEFYRYMSEFEFPCFDDHDVAVREFFCFVPSEDKPLVDPEMAFFANQFADEVLDA